ncbi:uncharacterized protein [Procambarus clarkii]|uniref:uncharacterized protein n=1 Tax=Procambarus clarkii TaxID=6728 RepID=UPI003743BC3B
MAANFIIVFGVLVAVFLLIWGLVLLVVCLLWKCYCSSDDNSTYGNTDQLKYHKLESVDYLNEWLEEGVWVLDEHGLDSHQAVEALEDFLHRHSEEPKVHIKTGRGLHSVDGPFLKPEVKRLLHRQGLKYRDIAHGGCFEVWLPKKQTIIDVDYQ